MNTYDTFEQIIGDIHRKFQQESPDLYFEYVVRDEFSRSVAPFIVRDMASFRFLPIRGEGGDFHSAVLNYSPRKHSGYWNNDRDEAELSPDPVTQMLISHIRCIELCEWGFTISALRTTLKCMKISQTELFDTSKFKRRKLKTTANPYVVRVWGTDDDDFDEFLKNGGRKIRKGPDVGQRRRKMAVIDEEN